MEEMIWCLGDGCLYQGTSRIFFSFFKTIILEQGCWLGLLVHSLPVPALHVEECFSSIKMNFGFMILFPLSRSKCNLISD